MSEEDFSQRYARRIQYDMQIRMNNTIRGVISPSTYTEDRPSPEPFTLDKLHKAMLEIEKFKAPPPMRVFESAHITIPHEDWSGVRSPARARRRRKRGFPQNIKIVQVPDPKIYMVNGDVHGHPETIRQLLKKMEVGQ